MSKKLKQEFQYYIDHQSELVDKYDGKYVAIVGDKVVGVYNNEQTAIENTAKKHKLGTFFVHLVGRGKENYTEYALNIGLFC